MGKDSRHLVKTIVLGIGMLTLGFAANAQADNVFISSDSDVIMKVVREKGEIVLYMSFGDSLNFSSITIERKADFDVNFSQCKYISYDDAKAKNMQLILKDTYPFPGNTDVWYRLKLLTKDGIIRIYPPIRLDAVNKKS
jgi:hypothetical protein